MALILVVEPEDRYVQRIRDALSSEGWQIRVVEGADDALSAAETEPPQLVLVNRQARGAERLFDAFARRTGGPGVVALLPESAIDLADPLADEALAKPFTDQDLRLAVRRGLHGDSSGASGAGAKPKAAPEAERQLTTQDIFGDLVAEVESEIRSETSSEPPAPEPAAHPAQPSPPQPSLPQPSLPPSSPPARPPASKPPLDDDELDLEKTLSGLRRDLQLDSRPAKPRQSPPPAEPTLSSPASSPAAGQTVRPETPKRPRISDDLDVDALLSETLSGLDLSSTKRKKKPVESPPTPSAPTHVGAPDPARTEVEPEEPDPNEISFADLSAPSLQEVPAPGDSADDASIGDPFDDEVEVDLEMELEGDDLLSADLAGGLEESGAKAAGPKSGGEEDERSAVPLGKWLESDEDSMVEIEEPMPDLGRPPGEALAEEAQDEGQRFGQYTLLDRIAVGGMAEVWKARMSGVEGFQKTVAIKKILPHLTDNDDFVDMFIDEAKLAAQLNHPNIIHIYDLGKIGDHFYIAMEYVEGKNLRALLNESRKKALPLPRGLAVLIAARLASALDHAHRKKDFEDRELGLVHRDVSPQNVLISNDGDIKLCDFGIVKAVSKASQTQMGALKGKLQYMSPEQAWGKDVDARSDIFSLGAILFEMLTGRRLFSGDSEISVLEAVRQCQVVAPRDLVPQIPEDVERITLKTLAMDPERRYQTAGKLQQELESVVYSFKPALGPADLADYLKRLAAAKELEGAEAAAVSAPEPTHDREHGREGLPRARAARDAAVQPDAAPQPEAPAKDAARDEETGGARPGEMLTVPPDFDGAESAAEPETEPQTQTGTLTHTGTETRTEVSEPPPAAEVVQAVSGTALDDLEEGGGRGRIWLWMLIGLLLLAGAAVTYYLYFVRPAASSTPTEMEEPAAGESAKPLPASPLDDPDLEDGSEDESGLDDPSLEEPGADEPTEETTEGATQGVRPEPPDQPEPAAVAATSPAAQPVAARPPSSEPPRETREQPIRPPTVTAKTGPAPTPTREPGPAAEGPSQPAAETPSRKPAAGETAAAPSRSAPLLLRPPSAVPPEAAAKAAETERVEDEAQEPESEPLATVDVAEPVRDPGAETESPTETAGREVPRLRPAEPKPEPPPQPPPEPEVREGDLVGAGPGVKAPVLVRFDKPSYPPIARRMRVEGEVVLSLLVDENGRVLETRLIKGVREGVGLNEAALDAARRARYEPATKNGVRVKMWTTLRIPFRL